jgi:hypothetical protein
MFTGASPADATFTRKNGRSMLRPYGRGDDGMSEGVKTGEYGFCPTCGEVVEAKVTPGDRLQARLARAARTLDYQDFGALGGRILDDGMERLKLGGIQRPALMRMMQGLVLLEAALNEEGGEPVDLLREATEAMEAWAEVEGR